MLKEIMKNIPIELNLNTQDFQINFIREIIVAVYEKSGIDLVKDSNLKKSAEIEKFVKVMADIYKKISANTNLSYEYKNVLLQIIMNMLFDLWQNSDKAEVFFVKILQQFTPAQIVNSLNYYSGKWSNYKWIINFFAEHKKVFPTPTKKIRTIGIYYTRIFNGGIEKFISMTIPVYLKLGYRVILFTDLSFPELEYPILIPDNAREFLHVTFSTPRNSNLLLRLNELSTLIKKYDIDLWISHMRGADFPPFVQCLFCRLSGIKTVLELHSSIKADFDFRLPNLLAYNIIDAVVVISRIRREFLKNFGFNAYYVQNPITINNSKEFTGRNPKKISNTILWVGRIDVTEKNIFAVVPIMKEVIAKIPNAKLKILGAADVQIILEKLKEMIKINHLENNIEFCGFHTDVQPFYESADVMLSTSPHEGWSLVIAESKFYELPLVLYELPDNEFMRDKKGLIAVKQGDYKAAAQAIVKILNDEEIRCKLSVQARESLQPFLEYDFSGAWKKIFDDLENNESIPAPNFENKQIQTILLEEIFELQHEKNSLMAQIQNKL